LCLGLGPGKSHPAVPDFILIGPETAIRFLQIVPLMVIDIEAVLWIFIQKKQIF
jgi:hypothetical protein